MSDLDGSQISDYCGFMTVRDLIQSLGGYRAVAVRISKQPTTVHTHMQSGSLPAAWYDALCRMAEDANVPEPSRAHFSFLQLEQAQAAGLETRR